MRFFVLKCKKKKKADTHTSFYATLYMGLSSNVNYILVSLFLTAVFLNHLN